ASIVLAWLAGRRFMILERETRAFIERKANELEAFAARVAHDLLSPLTSIGIGVDLVQQRLASPEYDPQRTQLVRASSHLHRIHRSVAGRLEFARSGATPTPGARADIGEVLGEVAEAYRPLAEETGAVLRIGAPVSGTVACSAGVLTSVLSNLIGN